MEQENVKLAIEFIVRIVPEELKASVLRILTQGAWTESINSTQMILGSTGWMPTGVPKKDVTLAGNGIILGFSLLAGVLTNPALRTEIKNFIEADKKNRGENVRDFGDAYARRITNSKKPNHSGDPGPTG